MRRFLIAGFLLLLSAAGCTSMPPTAASPTPPQAPQQQAPESTVPAAPPSQVAPPQEPPAAVPPSQPPANAAPASAASGASSRKTDSVTTSPPNKAEHAAAPVRPPVAQSRPSSAPAPATAPAPASTPATPAAAPPAAAAAKPQALPTLNLTDLEQRLRETRAIGVFAKLSLKNQVDDLLSAFRELYRVPNKRPPAELRQRYDQLLLKVLSLLQDSDPPLAMAIASSREAIWSILADPDKFSKI